jgi:MFS family permease
MTSAIIGIIGSILSIFSFVFSSNPALFNFPLFIIGRIFQGIMVGIDMTFCLVLIN